MPNDEPPRGGGRTGGRRQRRAGRPKEDPRPGDLKPQPQDRWGELYCVYKLYDRHGTLLYVGVTDDVVRQLTEHERGTRLQWGGRLDDRSRWWSEVVHVTVEHLPAGTTEWEAKLYERSQLALGPRYNTGVGGEPEAARTARMEAEQRDAERHDRARQLHARHDGVTRAVRPTLSIVPRFPNSASSPGRVSQPAPRPEPEPVTAAMVEPSAGAVTGAHDVRRPSGPGGDPEREPVLAGSRSGRAAVGNGEPSFDARTSAPPGPVAPASSPSGATGSHPQPETPRAATSPAPPQPALSPLRPPEADRDREQSLEHQGRYLLLAMAGVFLGIVVLSVQQMVH
ncbi:MAG: hypothetical protein R2761_00955 [Acidimicrobiales bacterium]